MTHSESMPFAESWANFKSTKRIELCVFVLLGFNLVGLVIPFALSTIINIVQMGIAATTFVVFLWKLWQVKCINYKVNKEDTLNVFEKIEMNFFDNTPIIDSPIVDTKIAPKEDYEDTTTLDTSDVSKVESDDTSMGLKKNLWSSIKIPIYDIFQKVITARFKHDSYEIIVYEWFLTREINETNLTDFQEINVTFYGDVFFGEDILFRKFQFTVLMILCSYLLGGIMYIFFTWTYYIISILLETLVLAVIFVKIKHTHGLDVNNFDFMQIWQNIKDSVKYVVVELFDTVLPSWVGNVLRYCVCV
jgi:hypothetical protein